MSFNKPVQYLKPDRVLRNILLMNSPKFSWRIAGLCILFHLSMSQLGGFANYYFLWYIAPKLPILEPFGLLEIKTASKRLSLQDLKKLIFLIVSQSMTWLEKTLISSEKLIYWTDSCLFVPVAEELFSRGVIQNLLIVLFKKPSIGISLASIVFAWLHRKFTFIGIFFHGLSLGYVYFWTKDLRYSILCHSFWNFYVSNARLDVALVPSKIVNLLKYADSGWYMPIWALIALFSGDALYGQYQQSQGVPYVSLFKRIKAKLLGS